MYKTKFLRKLRLLKKIIIQTQTQNLKILKNYLLGSNIHFNDEKPATQRGIEPYSMSHTLDSS